MTNIFNDGYWRSEDVFVASVSLLTLPQIYLNKVADLVENTELYESYLCVQYTKSKNEYLFELATAGEWVNINDKFNGDDEIKALVDAAALYKRQVLELATASGDAILEVDPDGEGRFNDHCTEVFRGNYYACLRHYDDNYKGCRAAIQVTSTKGSQTIYLPLDQREFDRVWNDHAYTTLHSKRTGDRDR